MPKVKGLELKKNLAVKQNSNLNLLFWVKSNFRIKLTIQYLKSFKKNDYKNKL